MSSGFFVHITDLHLDRDKAWAALDRFVSQGQLDESSAGVRHQYRRYDLWRHAVDHGAEVCEAEFSEIPRRCIPYRSPGPSCHRQSRRRSIRGGSRERPNTPRKCTLISLVLATTASIRWGPTLSLLIRGYTPRRRILRKTRHSRWTVSMMNRCNGFGMIC